MKPILSFLLTFFSFLALAGCRSIPATPAFAQVAQSNKERITSPQAPNSEIESLVSGNTAFALDLYRQLGQEKSGNFFYSPYSISLALAMTYAGARGETEKQMAQTLHFTLPQGQLHPAFNALDLHFASLGQGAQGANGEGFRLNIANALWGQRDFPFLNEFLDTLAQNYGAGIRLLDFSRDPEASRQTINRWVSDQTEEKIQNLIPPGVIDPLTRLVLTNAIYFNAAWAHPFKAEHTTPAPFYLLDGSQVQAPMMQTTATLTTFQGEDYQAVILPYDGYEVEMAIIMPSAGKFAQVEQALSAEWLNQQLTHSQTQKVELHLPKFKVESDFSLVNSLSTLGMPLAFTEQADFSGMDGQRDLYIGEVIHKAYVSVDEAGTEAAAATAVIMELTAAMPETVTPIILDHPFLFLIRDTQTGSILFLGRLMNPVE